MNRGIPIVGYWNTSRPTANAGTAIVQLCPPFPGPAGPPPYVFNAQAGYAPQLNSAPVATRPNWLTAPRFGVTRISSLSVQAGSTAHQVIVMRPLNWSYFPAGLAKNTTAVPNASATGLYDDPGLYATTYKYPTAGAVAPGQVADAAISSTNKLVCYQLADGTWQVDTVASGTYGSSLTLTTGTPNRTGGAVPAGGVLFYFGAAAGTLADPATGQPANQYTTVVSVNAENRFQDNLGALYSAVHPGDPLLVYDANATNADYVSASGYYSAY